MTINTVHDFRRAIRNGPYAWPGGYPCFFLTDYGEALSFKTVKQNRRRVLEAIAHGNDPDWKVICLDVNWEDGQLYCAVSGERIESAYAEPDDT